MGCASSRFDKRNSCSNDLNTIGLSFVGGESHTFDDFPMDRVGWAVDKTKETEHACAAAAEMTAGDEVFATATYKAAFTALSAKLKELEGKYGDSADSKTQWHENKYEAKDAIAHLKTAIEFFKEKSGITVEEEGAKKEEETDKKDEEADKKEEGAENSGGEEEEKKDGEGDKAMEKANPHKYDGDAGNYDGWAKIPAAFLKQSIVSPYVGDMIKAEAINWEFNPESAKVSDFTAIAGLISNAAAQSAGEPAEVWLSGLVGEEDMLSLKDISEGESPSKKIHFPFVTVGWKSKDEALQDLALLTPQKGTYHKVLFECTGAKAMEFVGCRMVCSRLNGTIDAAVEMVDDVNTFKIAATPLEEKNIEKWKADVAAAAAAAAEAAKAPPAEEKKEEGDEKKEGDDEKKEGEGDGGEEKKDE
jgi:ribosomal protein L12E/L44/L45/RPP1/RPP2